MSLGGSPTWNCGCTFHCNKRDSSGHTPARRSDIISSPQKALSILFLSGAPRYTVESKLALVRMSKWTLVKGRRLHHNQLERSTRTLNVLRLEDSQTLKANNLFSPSIADLTVNGKRGKY